MRSFWTARNAIRFGLIGGAAALVLWPIYGVVQQPALPWFMLALALTAVCGLSILAFTAIDLLTVRRARSMLPARMFDLALGLLLSVPSGGALLDLLG
jgi:putative flippase GtrA